MKRKSFAALIVASWVATFASGAFDMTESTAQNLGAAFLTWLWLSLWCSFALARRYWVATPRDALFSGWVLIQRGLWFSLAALLLSQTLYYVLIFTRSSFENLRSAVVPLYAVSGVLTFIACLVAPLAIILTWVTPLRKTTRTL